MFAALQGPGTKKPHILGLDLMDLSSSAVVDDLKNINIQLNSWNVDVRAGRG